MCTVIILHCIARCNVITQHECIILSCIACCNVYNVELYYNLIFWGDHHNNYYIIMVIARSKECFNRTFDPDEIQTESKRS